jgi:hypothetical protein
MSSILYYSKFCNSSNKILQILTKFNVGDQIHFVCIDSRIKKNGKNYAVLGNGQEMPIPENITAVPALLILNQQYRVIYGNEIINFFQNQMNAQIDIATNKNKIPINSQANTNFSEFGGFSGGIVSDSFSYLDQDATDLSTKGNGGLRQMHNYAGLSDDAFMIQQPIMQQGNNKQQGNSQQQQDQKSNKIKEGEYTLDQLKQQREQELQMYAPIRRI